MSIIDRKPTNMQQQAHCTLILKHLNTKQNSHIFCSSSHNILVQWSAKLTIPKYQTHTKKNGLSIMMTPNPFKLNLNSQLIISTNITSRLTKLSWL